MIMDRQLGAWRLLRVPQRQPSRLIAPSTWPLRRASADHPALDLDGRGTQKVESINSLSDEEEHLHIAQETNTSSRTLGEERETGEDGREELLENSGGHPQDEATDAWRRPSGKNFRYNTTTMLVGGLLPVSAVGLYAVYADWRHKAFDMARMADRVAERLPPPPLPTPAEADTRK